MKHHLATLAAATAFALPLPAAAFDVATLLVLEPGNWGIQRDNVTGEQVGYVVSLNAAGQTVQSWYTLQGGVWAFDSASLFVVTRNRITYVGEDVGNAVWTFEPALTIPRRWAVNDVYVYKGLQRNSVTGETVPVGQVVTFTAENLTATTPAGSFTGCVKGRIYGVDARSSRDSVSIHCPGRTQVMNWVSKIVDTAAPTVMDQSEVRSSVSIAGGSSGAPFP